MKVGYSTSIPVAAYGIKDNAWCEIEVDDERTFTEVWLSLKAEVDAAVRKAYPHLYETTVRPNVSSSPYMESPYGSIPSIEKNEPPPPIQVDRTIGITVDHINSCNDLTTLASYKFLVKGKEHLQNAYDQRLNELS